MNGRVLLVVGILTTNDVSAFTSVISSTKRIAIVSSNSIALQRHLDNKSGSRSSTSLSAMALPSLSAATASISGFYKAFPLLAGFLTCSTKASIADSMAQYSSREEDTKFSFKRNFTMVIYSGVVLGMLCEIMYNNIFPIMFGTANTLFRAVKCTLFDGFINAPFLWLPPAYIAKAIVYRYPKRDGIKKYMADIKDNGLLKKYWSVWLPASLINFLFVPAHFRIAFVAAVSFFWMIILSIVANNND